MENKFGHWIVIWIKSYCWEVVHKNLQIFYYFWEGILIFILRSEISDQMFLLSPDTWNISIHPISQEDSPSVVSSPMSVFAKLCLNFWKFWHNVVQADVISANFVMVRRSWSWIWFLFQNYCLQIVDFLLYSRQNITVIFVINSEWNKIIIGKLDC